MSAYENTTFSRDPIHKNKIKIGCFFVYFTLLQTLISHGC